MSKINSSEKSNRISRRKVLRSAGSGAVALGSTSLYAQLAAAEPDGKGSPDKKLGEVVREVAGNKDVVNLMGRAWSRRVRSGKLTTKRRDGDMRSAVSTGREEIAVKATTQMTNRSNEMSSIGFLTENREVLVYYEYESAERGVKTNANLWNVSDEGEAGKISLVDASYNGEMIKPPGEISTNGISTESDDPCGGCDCLGRGDTDGGYELDEVCDGSIDLVCALNVIGCAGCVGCSGTGWCALCVLTACPTVAASCCDGQSETCKKCNCSGGSR